MVNAVLEQFSSADLALGCHYRRNARPGPQGVRKSGIQPECPKLALDLMKSTLQSEIDFRPQRGALSALIAPPAFMNGKAQGAGMTGDKAPK
jgi:hypothetical protein